MFKKMGAELKVGIFAVICILVIAYATIQVGDRSIVVGGGYDVDVLMDTAIGIRTKTPVEIAGIQVGVVKNIKLDEDGRALVTLLVSNDVKLPEGSKAFVRAKGFLGQTFIELRPGPRGGGLIAEDSQLEYGGVVGDVNILLSQFNEIAADIKSVTGSLKEMVGSDSSSPVYRSVQNLDQFSEKMMQMTIRNEENMNRIVDNLAELTQQLRDVVAERSDDINQTLANLSSITGKVDRGDGSIGKLVNDETTVNKLNTAIDNLNDALGGLNKLETQIGYHGEYLGATDDFKNYVHLNFWPTPDEAFLFEFVSDPSPSPVRAITTTDITAGGSTSTVETRTATVEVDRFLFSAELAKKFYDFTLRGGIIESTGGVGLDYDNGPLGLQFSAFDFDTNFNQEPHLKAMGKLNLTKSLYLVGGADDFINPVQPVDWFVGAGFSLTDRHVKSILGLATKAYK